MRPHRNPIHVLSTWVRRQPPKVKAFLAVVSGMAALVLLRFIVHDHDNLFVAAEAVHSIGIAVLIYKLTKEKTCAGIAAGHPCVSVSSWFLALSCAFLIRWVMVRLWSCCQNYLFSSWILVIANCWACTHFGSAILQMKFYFSGFLLSCGILVCLFFFPGVFLVDASFLSEMV